MYSWLQSWHLRKFCKKKKMVCKKKGNCKNKSIHQTMYSWVQSWHLRIFCKKKIFCKQKGNCKIKSIHQTMYSWLQSWHLRIFYINVWEFFHLHLRIFLIIPPCWAATILLWISVELHRLFCRALLQKRPTILWIAAIPWESACGSSD